MQVIDRDANVGRMLVAYDMTASCSPCLEALMPGESATMEDVAKVTAILNDKLREAIESLLCDVRYVTPDDRPIEFVVLDGRTGIIKPRAERIAEFRSLQRTDEEVAKDRAEAEARLDAHQDNGKLGWWRVEGMRHGALVNGVSTAREAIAKSGVDYVECVEFIAETLPDVVEV